MTTPVIRAPTPDPILIVPVSPWAWMPSCVTPVMAKPPVSLTFSEPEPAKFQTRTPVRVPLVVPPTLTVTELAPVV